MKRERQSVKRTVLAVLCLLLAAELAVSLSLGRYPLPLGSPVEWSAEMKAVLWNIRGPRVVLACLVGCCLSASGAVYQGVFGNVMAAPDLLGASSGAAFGAALAILFGASGRMVVLSAFLFSLLSIVLVCLVGRRSRGRKTVGLILSGMMVGSLFSAGTSYIKLAADPGSQLPAITYWLMGSLAGTGRDDVSFAFTAMAVGMIPLFLLRWRMNLLTLDDEEAKTIGVHTGRLRVLMIVGSTLITAASVSVSGTIGWVGLVVPNLARRLIGDDYRYLLPAAMLSGACFLLLVDDFSRTLLPTELPLGVLTAFVGAPFFLFLITGKEAPL